MSDTYNIAYRYKAQIPDDMQDEIEKHFEIHKNIFNWALETLDESNEWISKYGIRKELTKEKKKEDNRFDEVHSLSAQQTIGRIYRAIDGLSTLKQNGEKVGKVRYKSHVNSIEYNHQSIKVNGDEIRFGKIGWIPFVKHRDIPDDAEIKGVILKRYGKDNWKVIFQLEFKKPEIEEVQDVNDAVGIDLNVSNFLVDTDGNKIETLHLKDELDRIIREQKKLSRKEHGSKNYGEQRLIVQQRHEELKNKRRDILHKISRYYIDNYSLICVEDIGTKELSESNISSMNQTVRLKHAWSEFLHMLEYKASQAGVRVVKVDPYNTSKQCSKCVDVQDKSLDERTHDCEECGLEVDRDYNAAVNVLQRGINQSSVGLGQSEVTPVETMTSGELHCHSPSHVVESGSHSLSESV